MLVLGNSKGLKDAKDSAEAVPKWKQVAISKAYNIRQCMARSKSGKVCPYGGACLPVKRQRIAGVYVVLFIHV